MPSFQKTNLAELAALPPRVRLRALLAALRFVAVADLGCVGVDAGEVGNAVTSGHVFRLPLQRRLTDETPIDVLALRRAGALVLAQHLGVDRSTVAYSTKRTCTRSAMFLDHTLARSRFALVLVRDLRDGAPAQLFSFEHDPDRLADSAHVTEAPGIIGRQPLVADALAVLDGPRGIEGLLVEIDRGTERPGYMAKKYAGYLAWWKAGGPRRRFDLNALRILTVAPDLRRTERLRETCREATRGEAAGLFWFATETDLVAHGTFAPLWSTTRDEGRPLWS